MPEFNWQPLVITTTEDATLVTDMSLLNDIPAEAEIHRVPGFSIARLQRRARKYGADRAVVALNLLLQLPDPSRFWSRNARQIVEKLILDERPQVIYTTSGPYGNHLLGIWAHRRYKIPWLADFRDPWSENLLMPYLPGYRRLNKLMERNVLENASRVVCVSQHWLDSLRSNCRKCPSEKFIHISNGYDDNDVQPLPKPKHSERFVLTYIGSFYRTRRPDEFIKSVDLLLNTGRLLENETIIRFVGKNAKASIPKSHPFESFEYIPHKELENIRATTDALLLILSTDPNNMGTPSGKIFEYIASNRPILAIVPKGGVAQKLIEETRTGIAVDGGVEAIAGAIEQMFHQWQAGFPDWNPDWDVIRQYTRRNLTEKLAAEFDKLLAEGN